MKQTDFEALDALVTVCEAEFTNKTTEDPEYGCDDSDSVGGGDLGDSPITFGHIRRARAALDAAKVQVEAGLVYLSNPPCDPTLAAQFKLSPSSGIFSEAFVAATKEKIAITFAGGGKLTVDFDPTEPLHGVDEHAGDALPYQAGGAVFPDFDPNRMVRAAFGRVVDVDDESWDDLEALLAARLPDLHSCGRSDLLGAIVDDWLPKLLARTPAPADTQAINDVIAERMRQVVVKGWTAELDDKQAEGELARAAMCYIWASLFDVRGAAGTGEAKWFEYRFLSKNWPFLRSRFRPTTPRRDLVKGLALGLAELERLDRIADAAEVRSALEVAGVALCGETEDPRAAEAELAEVVAAALVFMPNELADAIGAMIEDLSGVNGPGWVKEWLTTPHSRLGWRKPLDDLAAAVPLMAAIIHGLPA